MALITLTRLESTDQGVFGRVELDFDGSQFVSLERMLVEIPVGRYPLEWHISPHLQGAIVLQLIGVPGRSNILIHWGNTQNCSDGCILLGMKRDGNSIDSTRSACSTLFALVGTVGVENTYIEVR